MNTKQKGNLSEIKITSKLIELGYIVSLPFGDNARYDLIADKDGELHKIQVKTGQLEDGKIGFSTCSSSTHRGGVKKDYRGDVDFFGVYCKELDTCYLIPIDITPKRRMVLRLNETKNNQKTSINYANDYEI